MSKKLYAEELFKKVLSPKELKILETVWSEDMTEDQQLELLIKELQKCSSTK